MSAPDEHRHSIFCILAPHILREVARNGSAEQREAAARAAKADFPKRPY